MKLRISGNSLRLRLAEYEVAELNQAGLLEETVELGVNGGQDFVYALRCSTQENGKALATFERNRLTVYLPKREAEEWAQTDLISIRSEQTIGEGKILSILIEKDFLGFDSKDIKGQ